MRSAEVDVIDSTPSHRRFLLIGLLSVYAVAAVFGIRHQLKEPSWDPVLEPFVAFVEAERGLSFSDPVHLRWADISAELADEFERDRESASDEEEADPFVAAYELLGLIEVDQANSVSESAEDTATSQAGAFYDPRLETIVLPLGEDLDALGFTIVHELTHALQHQNGMLDWHLESADSASTRTTLIEGDAERVAGAWFDQLDPVERERFLTAAGRDVELSQFDDPGNTFFETSFNASYALGLPAVQAIIEAGGQKEIDRLLRSKSAGTSERLLDVLTDTPASSLDANEVIRLPENATSSDGDIGAVIWFQALAPQVGSGDAFDALVGYDDDAFVIFEHPDGRCGRFVLTFDSADDASEFSQIVGMVRSFVEPERISSGDLMVELTLCDPIGRPIDQRFGTIMPLVVANEMALTHLRAGVSVEGARCASLAQAATVPATDPLSSFAGWDEIDREAPAFLERCGSAVFSPS